MKQATLVVFAGLALVLAAPSTADAESTGLMTFQEFLNIRNLDASHLDARNCATEEVLNPRSRQWDPPREVCEVWVKEIAAKPLKYLDGTQVYRTQREDLFMVKEDQTVETTTSRESFKRYVTKGSQ